MEQNQLFLWVVCQLHWPSRRERVRTASCVPTERRRHFTLWFFVSFCFNIKHWPIFHILLHRFHVYIGPSCNKNDEVIRLLSESGPETCVTHWGRGVWHLPDRKGLMTETVELHYGKCRIQGVGNVTHWGLKRIWAWPAQIVTFHTSDSCKSSTLSQKRQISKFKHSIYPFLDRGPNYE